MTKKPTAPGDPPSNPSSLPNYRNKVKKYNKEIEVWQKNFSKWQEKRESAISGAEHLIDRFHKNYGSTFKVNLVGHWGALIISMVVMFGGILVIQKRKDLI